MPSLNITGCSINGEVIPVNGWKMWPEKCSYLTCDVGPDGNPWLESRSIYDDCGCCEFKVNVKICMFISRLFKIHFLQILKIKLEIKLEANIPD